MKIFKISLLLYLGILISVAVVTAQDENSVVPTMINYQGYLTDQNGKALTGSYEISFRIYDEASGNHPWLWHETQAAVTVENGSFNVLLGSIDTLTAAELQGERFLAIKMAGEIEMTPRMRLASVAYALQSENANYSLQADSANYAEESNRMKPDYDSGWFEANVRQTYTLPLGFTLTDLPMSIQIYYSDKAVPKFGTDEIWLVQGGQYYYSGGGMNAYVEIQDASTIKIHTGWNWILHAYTSGSETSPYPVRATTGYYRVRVWE